MKLALPSFFLGVFILPGLLLSGAAAASPGRSEFVLGARKVSITVPAGWKTVRDLYAIPLVLLSPDSSGTEPALTEDQAARRTSLSIIPTGAKDVELPPEGLQKDQDAYFRSKTEDLGSLGARITERFPYRYLPISGDAQAGRPRGVHRIGVRYATAGSSFVELSHYLVCNTEIWLLKALVPAQDWARDRERVEQAVGSFECR